MSLIACNECTHQISNKTDKCPNCGSPVKESYVSNKWVMIMDVIFAGIVVFGLQNLVITITNVNQDSSQTLYLPLLVAAGAYSFLLYDVLGYHLLIQKLPYKLSILGTGRFCLDIVMAFLLMIIVIPACRTPDTAILYILVGVTLWHVLAILWHVLAKIEHGLGFLSDVEDTFPHLGAIAAYWVILILFISFRKKAFELDSFVDTTSLEILSVLLIIVAIIRATQIIKSQK
jgi:hypothetical protein